MHPLMQNRHDTYVAIAEFLPVDEVSFIPKEESIHTKFSRYWSGHYLVARNFLKGLEQTDYIGVRLCNAPLVAGILINLVDAKRSRFLNTYVCQGLKPYFAQ